MSTLPPPPGPPPTPPTNTPPTNTPGALGDNRPPLSTPLPPATSQMAPPASPGQPRKRGFLRTLGLAAVFGMVAVGGGIVGAFVYDSNRDSEVVSVTSQIEDSNTAASVNVDSEVQIAEPVDFDARDVVNVAAVADRIAPSVVTISADVTVDNMERGAVGTGVLITETGDILTNAHVIEGASAIRVRLNGETEPVEAEVLAFDPGNDLALLSIEGSGYTPATFADPEAIAIGDDAVAVGFALDLDGQASVTLGIVSAIDRTLTVDQGIVLDGLIQTDAAISSGNSGGPLINARGELVGINTAVFRGDMFTAATNVGFAISVAEVLEVLPQLRAQAAGEVREDGFLGVNLQPRIDGGQGALIGAVNEGTPAAAAGLLAGDIVIAVDDAPVGGFEGLIAAIRDQAPGDTVALTVLRDGEELTREVTLVVRPPEPDS